MNVALILLQIILALGIMNVWFLRAKRSTPYRGSTASNLREEFAAYGLSRNVMIIVGSLKLLCAFSLLAGIWMPTLITPAATMLALLMIGAIAVHIKVKDPLQKSIPAIGMLLMCLAITFLSRGAV